MTSLAADGILAWRSPGGAVAASTTDAFAATHGPGVEEAADALRRALGARDDAPVGWMRQVHGDDVLWFSPQEGATGTRLLGEADILATDRRGVVLVTRTADCVPIVLAEEATGLLAVVHSGWRGVYAGAVATAARALVERGAAPAALHAWIGPCIRQRHYEVSAELAAQFAARWGQPGAYLDGRRLDLPALVARQLRDAGLAPAHITDCGECTFGGTHWPSHRRQGAARRQIFTAAVLPP